MKRAFLPIVAMLVGAVTVGLVLLRATSTQLAPMKGRLDVVEASADPELAAAVTRAKRELPNFIRSVQKPAAGQSDFAVNGRFETPRGFEQIWVAVDRYESGVFYGRLNADPVAIPGKRKGDAVQVPDASVSDWLFRDNGKLAGGYTMELLLRRSREGKDP